MQDNGQVNFGPLHTQRALFRDGMLSQLPSSLLFKADSGSLTSSGYVYNALSSLRFTVGVTV
jgi:hypothetical protein